MAAALLAVPLEPARAAVFGTDDRTPLPATDLALAGKIGILYESRSHTVCSAFCVGGDIVATASHCVFRTSGEAPPQLTGFSFRLTDAPPRSAARIAGAQSGASAQNVIAGSTHLSIRPPIEATSDWALLRLAKPACVNGGFAVSHRTAAELEDLAAAQRIYQVGFHRDVPGWQLARGGPCEFRRNHTDGDRAAIARDFAETRQLFLHSCDTGPASSGSPLLIDGPHGPEVVAINVGTYVRSRVLIENGDVVHRYKADTIANTAVASSAFAARLVAFAHAEIIDSRQKLQELQSRLAQRGFYSGPRDGAYGPLLKSAIEDFEKSENRPVLGLATAGLLKRLTAGTGLAAQTADEGRAIETGSVGKPLKKERAPAPSGH